MMNDYPEDECANEADAEYLPLYFQGLTQRLIQQAKEELFEDDDDATRTALSKFRALIRDSANDNVEFPTADEELVPFLRARKYNVNKAYTMYMKYFTQFRTYDKLFKDTEFHDILKIIQSNCIGFLPRRDSEGCAISIIICENWNPLEFNVTDMLKAAMTATMDIIRCPITQITGIKLIVDCTGLSLSRLSTIRPWHLKYISEVIQKSTPLRFKGFHLLNNGPIFHIMFRFLRSVLPEKIINRTYFHGKDLESLHQYISPSILPSELGGSMGPFNNAEYLKDFLQSGNDIVTKIKKFNADRL